MDQHDPKALPEYGCGENWPRVIKLQQTVAVISNNRIVPWVCTRAAIFRVKAFLPLPRNTSVNFDLAYSPLLSLHAANIIYQRYSQNDFFRIQSNPWHVLQICIDADDPRFLLIRLHQDTLDEIWLGVLARIYRASGGSWQGVAEYNGRHRYRTKNVPAQ